MGGNAHPGAEAGILSHYHETNAIPLVSVGLKLAMFHTKSLRT